MPKYQSVTGLHAITMHFEGWKKCFHMENWLLVHLVRYHKTLKQDNVFGFKKIYI